MTEYPYDLGGHTYPITANPEAQTWFDRGLTWTYGFNHDEAVRCFERAAQAEPTCAMAQWGIAYAGGPNYNLEWYHLDEGGRGDMLARCHAATAAALALIEHATPWEAALIRALPARYPQPELTDLADMNRWLDAYAAAMRAVQSQFPESREVRAVAVEAMMQRHPWALWDMQTGAPQPGADTVYCRDLLETAFRDDPAAWHHPGLLHLYVHLMEMSPTPEAALRQGDRLRDLVPDAGHLVHMPTHIDVQSGAYSDVMYWNQKACRADEKYFEREGAFNIYTAYRQHDYHFVAYGAMFLGQMQPALDALAALKRTTPEALLRVDSPPMADFLESYLALVPHVYVRFGQWERCLDLPLPEDRVLYCTVTANVLYARALALAALGRPTDARAVQAEFLAACDRVPDTRMQHTNTVRDILEVGKAMLEGEILYREGAYEAGFSELRRAVALEEGLNYDEPWGWMQPVRHALGALLLERGHVTEAEACFRADLGLACVTNRACAHPGNVWALRGLHDCLAARNETVERVLIAQQLAVAEARADGPVRAACGCAQVAMDGAG